MFDGINLPIFFLLFSYKNALPDITPWRFCRLLFVCFTVLGLCLQSVIELRQYNYVYEYSVFSTPSTEKKILLHFSSTLRCFLRAFAEGCLALCRAHFLALSLVPVVYISVHTVLCGLVTIGAIDCVFLPLKAVYWSSVSLVGM